MSGKSPLSTATINAQPTPLLLRRLSHPRRLHCRTGGLPHTFGSKQTGQTCRNCFRLQTTIQAGSFKRRSRRFEDSLLDNLDSSRADPRYTKEQPASQNYPVQPTPQNAPATSQAKQRRKAVVQPQEDRNQQRESKQNTATDDWGWGYTGPTLATIGGDYEEKLRAPTNSTNATQPAEQQASEDNWGEEEEMRDWEDDEQMLDDDLPEEEAPDVTLLNSNDVEQLLKLVPQQQQIQYYGGTPVDLGVRVGTGLVLTLAASKIPLLAAGTLFYPVWWPIYKAWSQNQKLRSQYRYIGLWRTKLLELKADQRPGMMRANSYPSSLTFLIGNVSSARTQISVPFNDRYEDIQVGESAELLLLSNTADFSSFKALKEAYLPESGIWIAKYPFVDRDVFLDISLDIARSEQLS